jgi:hypothetical protein
MSKCENVAEHADYCKHCFTCHACLDESRQSDSNKITELEKQHTFYIVTNESDGYVNLAWFKSEAIAISICEASVSEACELHEFKANNVSGIDFSDDDYSQEGTEDSIDACPECGKEDCEHSGITCQFCDRGCDETEIHHVCGSLGTICEDCDNSGEYPEYWEPEENE